jgi:hypothetical protein
MEVSECLVTSSLSEGMSKLCQEADIHSVAHACATDDQFIRCTIRAARSLPKLSRYSVGDEHLTHLVFQHRAFQQGGVIALLP